VSPGPFRLSALNHPIRLRILATVAKQGKCSPKQFTDWSDNGETLATVAYHFHELVGAGFLALAGLKPKRGAVEHFYRLDGEAAQEAGAELERVGRLLRTAGERASERSAA
jgi:DNA-binding transcriptional ArsR family regulator